MKVSVGAKFIFLIIGIILAMMNRSLVAARSGKGRGRGHVGGRPQGNHHGYGFGNNAHKNHIVD